MKRIKKTITISILFSLYFAFSCFADAAIIYAPSQIPKIKEEVQSIVESSGPAATGDLSLWENASQQDYVGIYDLCEDDNGNLYVKNSNNTKATSCWRKIDIDSFANYTDVEGFRHNYIWVFVNSSGKLIKGTSGKIRRIRINGNMYAFNEYGQCLEGYFNEQGEMWKDNGDDPLDLNDGNDKYLYYSNPENCILQSGWHKFLEYTDKYNDKENIWLYFNPSNHRSVKATGKTYKIQKIDGKEYAFDNLGVMLTGFEAMRYNEEQGGQISQIKYFNSDGSLVRNGFVLVNFDNEYNEEKYSEYIDYEEDVTIYLNKSGTMYKDQMRKINGAYYGFDKNGVMLKYCLSIWNNGQFIDTISVEDTNPIEFIVKGKYTNKQNESGVYTSGSIYYFDSGGKRQDNTTVYLDGEKYTYKANSQGAVEGLKDKKFYVHGLLMKPEDDKYGIYLEGANGSTYYSASEIYGNQKAYVVNKSGQKQASKSVLKDDNDNYWLLNNSGNLIGIYTRKVKQDKGLLYYYDDNTSKWVEFDGNSYRAHLYSGYCLNFLCRY